MTRQPEAAIGNPVVQIADAPSPHEVYTKFLADSVLAFQACTECQSAVFPPRQRCVKCGEDALVWRSSTGDGVIYSATMISPRNADAYCVVLVDLAEGYRMMSRITGIAADEVYIGQKVTVTFQTTGDEVLPMFAPKESPHV